MKETINNQARKSALDRFCLYCTHHRLGVLVATLLLAAALGTGIPRIKGDVLLEDLLPYGHPFLKIIWDFSNVFGAGGSWVGILVESRDGDIFKPGVLNKILEIDNEVALWPEAFRAMTYSIGSRSAQVARISGVGEVTFESVLFPKAPQTEKELATLKKNVFSDETLRRIVSRDGNAAIVQTQFKPDVTYERAFELVQGIVKKHSDGETSIELLGFPVLMGWIYSLKGQIVEIMLISVAIMLVILFFVFRNLIGMAAPAIFGLVATAMGLGFIGWTGLNFSPLLYVLAFLVGARKASHAVQATHRYMEEYDEARDSAEACYRTMRAMVMPNWTGVLTDAAGFFVLIFIQITLMQQVAIFMTAWILVVSMCGIFTPVVCSYIPMAKASKRYVEKKKQMSVLDKICTGAASFCIGPGRWPVASIVVAALAFCGWKASGLKIGDPTPGTSLLYPKHPYNQATARCNEYFGATSDDLVLYFKGNAPGAVYHPGVFRTFASFDRHMRETLPDIYKSSDSFINIMTTFNTMVRDGDLIYRELPYDEEGISKLIGSTRAIVQPCIQRLYFDTSLQMSRIGLFFADHTSSNLHRIREAAFGFFDEHPVAIEAGEFMLAGGSLGMEIATNDEMRARHASIDLMVLGAIWLICSLFFGSVAAGLMLALPLVLANGIAYAYMAMKDIGLSINTLPVAAVGVGVGVDYAIYIYNRCIEEFPSEKRWRETILKAVRTSGKAVVFTGLIMVLPTLAWFALCDLKFQAQMGLFLAIILSANFIFAITLHPLMLYLIKPKFIRRGVREEESSAPTITAEQL